MSKEEHNGVREKGARNRRRERGGGVEMEILPLNNESIRPRNDGEAAYLSRMNLGKVLLFILKQ